MTRPHDAGSFDPPQRDHDDGMERLLRLGGSRVAVPPERESRVRAAVFSEIRAVAHARARRRRFLVASGALAASLVAFVVSHTAWPRGPVVATRVTLGSIERVEGTGGRLVAAGRAEPVSLRSRDDVRESDRIDTDRDGRASLRLNGGVSVRLDRGTRAHLVSSSRIELNAGAIYVDSGPSAPSLEVGTAFGLIKDVGTQFEVRVESAAVRVRVRSGLVEVRRGEEVSSARPGTELIASADGIERRAVGAYGADWEWASSLAPTFSIEGRPLDDFLQHVAREQGWTLAYAERQLALEASGIILHGSADGLTPVETLSVVLATTGLTHRVEEGQLVVSRGARP